MDIKKLLEEKYLKYFKKKDISSTDPLFAEFLIDIYDASEVAYEDTSSKEVLKSIMNKYGYEENFYAHINDVIEKIDELNELEKFTLLLFSSGRNILIYEL